MVIFHRLTPLSLVSCALLYPSLSVRRRLHAQLVAKVQYRNRPTSLVSCGISRYVSEGSNFNHIPMRRTMWTLYNEIHQVIAAFRQRQIITHFFFILFQVLYDHIYPNDWNIIIQLPNITEGKDCNYMPGQPCIITSWPMYQM